MKNILIATFLIALIPLASAGLDVTYEATAQNGVKIYENYHGTVDAVTLNQYELYTIAIDGDVAVQHNMNNYYGEVEAQTNMTYDADVYSGISGIDVIENIGRVTMMGTQENGACCDVAAGAAVSGKTMYYISRGNVIANDLTYMIDARGTRGEARTGIKVYERNVANASGNVTNGETRYSSMIGTRRGDYAIRTQYVHTCDFEPEIIPEEDDGLCVWKNVQMPSWRIYG